ncbi:MAG: replication-associated recombination protein A [Coriobacteriia bacterium]|nr:replication-associated recombination protein A [Coriobacteriia bacterium]
MDDLFSDAVDEAARRNAPLAVRMRPASLAEFVGQDDVLGPGTWLRSAIESDTLTSLILYGPPGSGKTSLARVIAATTRASFTELTAVSSGVADVRRAIDEARERLGMTGQRTILFIDEIHRFSRSQQDALLHAVEDGIVVLVGATTENPFFEVNSPLISRSRIVELRALSDDEVRAIVLRALTDERGLAGTVRATPEAVERLVVTAGGDARIALTSLELAGAIAPAGADGAREVGIEEVAEATATRTLTYDKTGDVHYDVVSAFIKSMRGSDPDAAVYWLARMVHGGEDPKFIARRMLIFAAEDVGNADPRAVLVAHAAVKAAEFIGWPEARINLAQAAAYLALAPKSNAAIVAIDSALAEVREGPARPVPDHLRDRHRPGADRYPAYRYPHDCPDARVEQQYLPDGLVGRRFWRSGERGWEARRAEEPGGGSRPAPPGGGRVDDGGV